MVKRARNMFPLKGMKKTFESAESLRDSGADRDYSLEKASFYMISPYEWATCTGISK